MTWTANLSGHADSPEVEKEIVGILRDATARIREAAGNDFSASYYSQHHGAGSLKDGPGGGAQTQDESAPPVPPAPPPTPPGPGTGSGG